MRIAVACDGTTVSAHFGRCERYLLAESEGEGENVEVVEWLTNPGHEPGALPELMREKGVSWVIAGGAGPRAVGLLEAAGIDLVIGVEGDALAAAKALADGTLLGGESTCQH